MTMLSVRPCASVLRALADETRLRLLQSLLAGDKGVNKLTQHLKCPQPHVSHHLRFLRDSGLVEGILEGRQVCYRVSPPLRPALAQREGEALKFGGWELRFPDAVLSPHRRAL